MLGSKLWLWKAFCLITLVLIMAVTASAKPFRDTEPEEKPFILLGKWESRVSQGPANYKVHIFEREGNIYAEWFTNDGQLHAVGCFERNIFGGWTETYVEGLGLAYNEHLEWARHGDELKATYQETYQWYLKRIK